MLQLAVLDLPGTGVAHVTLLYAEDPGYCLIFGSLSEHGVSQQDLTHMSKRAFGKYLRHYREVLVLLDPWGDTRVLDLASFPSVSALITALEDNLRLAGFTVGTHHDFRVQAIVPVRR
ncbi:hypothetical protein ACQUFY_01965 [Robbsia andropogonis]|uniref:hypothetical protein n=1 Tax=Robbsia andropogonis TaxID=28092 RepID=UPI003D1DC2EA